MGLGHPVRQAELDAHTQRLPKQTRSHILRATLLAGQTVFFQDLPLSIFMILSETHNNSSERGIKNIIINFSNALTPTERGEP